jgi:hypothetical protein
MILVIGGLRDGVLLPTVPPDVDWIKPLNHPDYDRLWAVCQDLEAEPGRRALRWPPCRSRRGGGWPASRGNHAFVPKILNSSS